MSDTVAVFQSSATRQPNKMNANLDLAILRTLLAIEKNGSMARAAEMVGRSESAISLQIKRLEDQLGQPLYRRHGRGLMPTAAGELMLSYARRLVELNNEALNAVATPSAEGTIRLGVIPDYSSTWLPVALAVFGRTHPSARVEVAVERGPSLKSRLEAGDLDLVIAFTAGDDADAPNWSSAVPMTWVGPPDYKRAPDEPVKLVIFDPPCSFRSAATAALDSAGIAWSIGFVSSTLPGLWAAVISGMGVTARSPIGLPPQLVALSDSVGLPRLPVVNLALFTRSGAVCGAVAECRRVLIETMQGTLGGAI
jgi:DNA-binding transcriptional LysR family regulator